MNYCEVQRYRAQQVATLPSEFGVYALCDARGVVRYVGQSTAGIRVRVQRHTTSARSDVIATRVIDPGEIAFVYAWPVQAREDITPLEDNLILHFDAISPLMNSKMPKETSRIDGFVPPEPVVVPLMPDSMIAEKSDPAYLLRRQVKQQSEMLDYIISTKSNKELERSFKASLDIIVSLTKELMN